MPGHDISALPWQRIVELLELSPHPEGGFYRETFRDTHQDAAGRARSTAIYFLLPAGIVSRWHRVDAAEAWHWYGGAPLRLSTTSGELGPDTANARHTIVGNDLTNGERPQHVVEAHQWQQARSDGEWTLVGCTVAPGFEFSGFEMIPD
jgi:predicted cupin superfamily sugar epimerase